MKNRFAEYYKPTDEEVQDMWSKATIVFDTNVLLDLYRYDTATRDEFIQIISFYKERLWIPYQVGWEFHRNREGVIKQNAEAYDRVQKEFCSKIDDLLKSADALADNHPLLNMSEIKKRAKTFKSAIEKSLASQKGAHPKIDNTNDVVLDTITELFEGRTGENFTEEELCKIYEEGSKRYEKKIPPGYCDKKDKKSCPPQELYGDLILWKQIIKWSAEQSTDIILVSSEEKEDWWNIGDDKTKTSRAEMLKEFIEQTQHRVLIYSRTAFLENAKKNKDVKVSAKIIKEVEKTEARTSFATFQYPFSDIYNDFIPLWGNVDYYHDFQLPDYTSQLRKIYDNIIPPSLGEFKHFVNQMGGLDVVKQMTERLEQSHWWERLPMMQTPSKDANNESNTTEQ